MTVMLGRLEPVCQGEMVLERDASLKEYTEREAIYTKDLDRLDSVHQSGPHLRIVLLQVSLFH